MAGFGEKGFRFLRPASENKGPETGQEKAWLPRPSLRVSFPEPQQKQQKGYIVYKPNDS